MSENISKISLSFTKKIEKKSLKTSAIGNDNYQVAAASNRQVISSFDKNTKL